MGIYRKKPVEVEAIQFDGSKESAASLHQWITDCGGTSYSGFPRIPGPAHLEIATLEGKMVVSPGDFVIKGVEGEFYPCKPSIFEASYDETIPSGGVVCMAKSGIAPNIRAELARQQKTEADLYSEDLTPERLSALLNGAGPSSTELIALCRALDCPLEAMMCSPHEIDNRMRLLRDELNSVVLPGEAEAETVATLTPPPDDTEVRAAIEDGSLDDTLQFIRWLHGPLLGFQQANGGSGDE